MAFGLPPVSFIGYPMALPRPGHAGLGLREVGPPDAGGIAAHYRRLSGEDRYLRFCAAVSDSALERHVAELWARASLVIAAHDGPLWSGPFHRAGPVRGLAELSLRGGVAELGLSVDAEVRRRGLGACLVRTAASVLAPRGISRLDAYTLPHNRAMIALGRAFDAEIDLGPDDVRISFATDALRRGFYTSGTAPKSYWIAAKLSAAKT